MQHLRSSENKQQSTVAGVLIGVLIAILLSLLMAGGVALLIVKEYTGIEKIQYFSIGIQYLFTVTGGYAATKITTKKPVVICGFVAALCIFLLFAANILLFDSSFMHVWGTLIAVVLGYVSACALCISKPKKPNYRKVHNR